MLGQDSRQRLGQVRMHSISLARDSNNMPNAYSEDLRWRAVWLNIVRGMRYKDIATTLFMCEKSVQRYLTLFHATGSVTPQPPTGGPSKVLNDLEEFTVMQSISQHSIYRRFRSTSIMLLGSGWVHLQSATLSRQRSSLKRKYKS